MEFKRYADIKRLKFIEDNLKYYVSENAHILDVGCGNGIISNSLGKLGYSVKGIDVSTKAIEKAALVNKLPNVSFEVKSAEQLIAEGITFDAVICSEVIEHLKEPDILLRTLYKSIENNGILIVTVPNGMGPREVLVTKPVQFLQKNEGFLWRALNKLKTFLGYKGSTIQSDADELTHIQFFTQESLENIAKRNGFNIIRFGKTNFIDDVFPISILTKRLPNLQKLDARIADVLPTLFAGGFLTVWKKNVQDGTI